MQRPIETYITQNEFDRFVAETRKLHTSFQSVEVISFVFHPEREARDAEQNQLASFSTNQNERF